MENTAAKAEFYDCLLSHRSKQSDYALWLKNRLESEQHVDGSAFRVWTYEVDIDPGESLVGAINRALETSRFVVLLLTPDYFQSETGWTDAEWQAALMDDPAGRTKRVIPVIVEDCPYVPALLRHLNMVDLRGTSFNRGYSRLVEFIRRAAAGDPDKKKTGQLFEVIAAGSLSAADPDLVEERLLVNLLPYTEMPHDIWRFPLLPFVDRGTLRLDDLRDLIHAHQEKAGLPIYNPVFVPFREEILTFVPPSEDHELGGICEITEGTSDDTSAWIADSAKKPIVTRLMNGTMRKHLLQIGLLFDHENPRFFFPPNAGEARIYHWRRGRRPRTVAKPLLDSQGETYRWRHSAAEIKVEWIGSTPAVQIKPTVVFTRDGRVDSILRGSLVGPLAMKWQGPERNQHLLYHAHFWAFVIGGGKEPIRMRSGKVRFVVDPHLLDASIQVGILGDSLNLEAQLEPDEEPDDLVDLVEEIDSDEGEEAAVEEVDKE